MRCSNLTKCENPNIKYFDGFYVCENCGGVYKKVYKKLNKKLIAKCCNKQPINNTFNKHKKFS